MNMLQEITALLYLLQISFNPERDLYWDVNFSVFLTHLCIATMLALKFYMSKRLDFPWRLKKFCLVIGKGPTYVLLGHLLQSFLI